jgi:uncharacterized phage protein (TIGR02220 family)
MADNYVMVKLNNALMRGELTPQEKAVMMALVSYINLPKIHPSQETLVKQSGVKRTRVIYCLKSLADKGFIKIKKDRHARCNEYQILKKGVVQLMNTKVQEMNSGVQQMNMGSSGDEQVVVQEMNTSINNNSSNTIYSNKGKSKKPDIPYKDIIDDLNAKANKKLQYGGKNDKLIAARWKEHPDIEKFKYVHSVTSAKWKDNEFRDYLHPSTLYRQSNFTKYLEWEVKRTEKSPVPDFKNPHKKFPKEIVADGKLLLDFELTDRYKTDKNWVDAQLRKWNKLTPDQQDEQITAIKNKNVGKFGDIFKSIRGGV